jgi:hypothetical protein
VFAMNPNLQEAASAERHYSVKEVATILNTSYNTARRICRDDPGVLKISFPRVSHERKRAPRVTLRVPASVLDRLHKEWAAGFGAEAKRGRRRV